MRNLQGKTHFGINLHLPTVLPLGLVISVFLELILVKSILDTTINNWVIDKERNFRCYFAGCKGGNVWKQGPARFLASYPGELKK